MARTLAWLLVFLSGKHDGKEATDHMATIPAWKSNAWGPAANLARAHGMLPPVPLTPVMKQWDQWGRPVLREGDVVFRLGDARLLYGMFPFSRFVANASGSKFSHTAVVAIEQEGPVIYDTTRAGVRRQPFAIWVLDNVGPFGVKRLRPQYRGHIPEVIAYCREIYALQVPFDVDLGLDDSSLYCVEMTEKAFRSAGLTLSEPIPLGDMENAPQFPICMFCIATLTRLKLDQPLYFPGNERHGIWGSPLLEQVYPPASAQSATAANTKGRKT
jgi:hypothetical protein